MGDRFLGVGAGGGGSCVCVGGRAHVCVSVLKGLKWIFWGRGAPPPHAAELESGAGLAPLLAVFTHF